MIVPSDQSAPSGSHPSEPLPSGSRLTDPRSGRVRRVVVAAATTLALVAVGVACGADGEDTVATQQLSEQAQRGLQVMNQRGCAACHGTDWNGGTGPALVGLYGTERTLIDGTVVIADEEYLTLAITDPSAQMLEGWSLRMPANSLDDAQVADIVAFIKEVGPSAGAAGAENRDG